MPAIGAGKLWAAVGSEEIPCLAQLSAKAGSEAWQGISSLARLSGFEPLAFRLGGGRSILLSYRRVWGRGPGVR